MKKGISPETNLRATKILSKKNINIIGGSIVGFPGETEESLKESYEHFLHLRDESEGRLKLIAAQPLAILPGAEYWTMLLQKRPDLFRPDYDPIEHQLVWMQEFCPNLANTPEESLKLLINYCKKIENLSPSKRKNRFGRMD